MTLATILSPALLLVSTIVAIMGHPYAAYICATLSAFGFAYMVFELTKSLKRLIDKTDELLGQLNHGSRGMQ